VHPSGLPNKIEAWYRAARTVGIEG
jgi:hypothetical protein